MISICIPVYNYFVDNLLVALSEQTSKIRVESEILIIDDCSEQEFRLLNKNAALKVDARYIQLDHNIGRSAIRNLLCQESKFENLLFLDCDSYIESDVYIQKYLEYLNKPVVVCGGRSYQSARPTSKYLLHWKYGLERECRDAISRNQFPTRSFMTNNFLIPKSVLRKLPFNEHLNGYGHEDTLLGIQLFLSGIVVHHIDNALRHIGLEENEIFLNKTQDGIRNLLTISTMEYNRDLLNDHVALVKAFSILKKIKLHKLADRLFFLFRPLLVKFITSKNPSLLAFDLYKLGFLCSIK